MYKPFDGFSTTPGVERLPMVDVPPPRIVPARRRRHYLYILPALATLIAVSLMVGQRNKCDSPIGKAAVRLKLDYYYSRCHCMKNSLDFSDPCNSMFVPLM